MVDVLGHLIGACVHGADVQDRNGAKILLQEFLTKHDRLEVVLADGAYSGELQDWFHRATKGKKRIQVVKRSDKPLEKQEDKDRGFSILPKRWIVERTFGWINWLRRFAKDYEHDPNTSLARLFIADAFFIAKKLAAMNNTI
jgi:putative transposase